MPLLMSLSLLVLLITIGPIPSSSAAALDPATPFSTTNQNPLVAIYGLPPTGSATLLAPGRTSTELRADIASVCSRNDRSEEKILLDGETYRFTLALRHGIGERFEVGLEIPYVQHREGFLDGFIIDWHNFFNLPQGERDDLPRDRLAYSYEKNGETEIDINDKAEGFGDLRLTMGWQLWKAEGDKALALRASLKLPTGDEDRLLGSGSTDVALWLSGSHAFRKGSLALFGGAGAMLMTKGDVLPDQQRHVVAFGTLGGGWMPLSRLALKVQVDGHTSFYRHSNLRELSESLQLTIGGTLGLTNSLALDIAVSEDIIVDSAPDVLFHLALRQTF
jgi:Protein of unknown function (DUF3187)